jgi:hypothetical protein
MRHLRYLSCALSVAGLLTSLGCSSYTCDGNGYPMIGPIGVCGAEGDDCVACTGSNVLSCL